MPGDIFGKERAIITLTSTGASLTNLSAGVANATADLDCRTAGNAGADFQAIFELTVQWATITGIVLNSLIADLFLVPALDGTNFPDLDTTSGSSALPLPAFAAPLVATKAPTANTNARYITPALDLAPLLYRPYLLNRSGQTMAANWTLKAVTARAQWT